jgi:hypothetical protein
MTHESQPNQSKSFPHVRFWSTGKIAVSAKERIEQLLLESKKIEVQAMIKEWVVE